MRELRSRGAGLAKRARTFSLASAAARLESRWWISWSASSAYDSSCGGRRRRRGAGRECDAGPVLRLIAMRSSHCGTLCAASSGAGSSIRAAASGLSSSPVPATGVPAGALAGASRASESVHAGSPLAAVSALPSTALRAAATAAASRSAARWRGRRRRWMWCRVNGGHSGGKSVPREGGRQVGDEGGWSERGTE